MNLIDVIPPTVSDQEPSLFYKNLPSVDSSFTLTLLPETKYYPFYNAVFNLRNFG